MHRPGWRLARLALAAAFGAALVLVVLPAAAARGESCEEWFPDFRCERSGRWEGFHKPIVQPFLFEDPFITTGLYPYYLYHDFPGRSIFRDGEMHVVALQARVALTDRLALIATKDGYAWNRPELELLGDSALNDSQGFFNISGGVKYALFQDEARRIIVSPALRVEVPTGSSDTLQGHSDGLLIPSISGAWGVERWSFMADFGSQIPFDGGQQSASLFYHVYTAYDLHPHFAPFVQLSGITWVHSGDGQIPVKLRSDSSAAAVARGLFGEPEVPLDLAQDLADTGRFEGADVIDLGSRDVAGQDLWTWALGAHVPLTRHLTFSAAYERPFSHQKGLYQQRVTTNLTLEF